MLSPNQPVAATRQRVDGAGRAARAPSARRERERLELERHRDVEAPPARARERVDRGGESVERRQQALVAHVLAGRARERRVDRRRLRVRDGVADDGVAAVSVMSGGCGGGDRIPSADSPRPAYGGGSLGDELVALGEGPGARDVEDVGVAPDVGRERARTAPTSRRSSRRRRRGRAGRTSG